MSFESIARHALLAVVVVGFVQYGSTKSRWGTVSVRNADPSVAYLSDAGSYVTNEFVHVALSRSPYLPDSADFYGYYRSIDSTNALDWVQFIDALMGDFSFPTNIPFANAISNDFIFGTSYVWQPAVTNGTVDCVRVPSSTNAVAPIRTGIYINGVKK